MHQKVADQRERDISYFTTAYCALSEKSFQEDFWAVQRMIAELWSDSNPNDQRQLTVLVVEVNKKRVKTMKAFLMALPEMYDGGSEKIWFNSCGHGPIVEVLRHLSTYELKELADKLLKKVDPSNQESDARYKLAAANYCEEHPEVLEQKKDDSDRSESLHQLPPLVETYDSPESLAIAIRDQDIVALRAIALVLNNRESWSLEEAKSLDSAVRILSGEGALS